MPALDWREKRRELEACSPWPRYYEFRSQELALVSSLCRLPRGKTLLELGCGNAFHSFLLSDRFETCIATDLHLPDSRTHTIGLDRARSLGEILEFESLRLVGASAEALPFTDASIDFVFSSNVLEHVPDQPRAVAEIFRVLRPGGRCLTIVPSAMERVYNLPVSYIRILHSVLRGLQVHGLGARSGSRAAVRPENGAPAPERAGSFLGRARGFMARHYPGFPFPNPHGEYPSSTAEFLAHRPARWESLFTSRSFHIEQRFTTILAPHVLGMAISEGAAYWVARAGMPLTRLLGARRPFRWLGTSYALLVRRPGGESP